ncbi:MAG TPA: alpha/beta hydrolase [Vicinamibacterales bacterium]|nr:alpha/beta hydrolase [Vicinamibacterales bacterium]
MFEGFREHRIRTGDADIFALTGGSGPPLLLLHGFPQNHVMWHQVAPRLTAAFSLVLPDLRGYGVSTGPPPDPDHRNYSKRAMAADMIGLMSAFGHERFFLAGHDRGGRVGYRLALDHPGHVVRLALLDILPTTDVWERMNAEAALRSYHWLLLAQPSPLPERLLGRDPDFYLRHLLDRWVGRPDALDAEAVGEYARHFRTPSVVEAMCEDYRAGATVDRDDDRADRLTGRRLVCPTLVLWAARYLAMKDTTPLDVWRPWAEDVRDVALDCGHFLAEEEPGACADALERFFTS